MSSAVLATADGRLANSPGAQCAGRAILGRRSVALTTTGIDRATTGYTALVFSAILSMTPASLMAADVATDVDGTSLTAWLSDPSAWSALAALLTLEIVLGVDNVVFISILAAKLPKEVQDRARRTGIVGAGLMRVVLLLAIGWIVGLKSELFTVLGQTFTGKDLVLLAGGLFLIYKATKEIHHKLEGEDHTGEVAPAAATFGSVIAQVLLLDLVFSVDSVITAVGVTPYVPVMVIAILTSIVVMLVASGPIYRFVNEHPSVKMLALAFLILIGMTLLAEGLGQKIPKGYVYAAMAFSIFVEVLNLFARRRREERAVELKKTSIEAEAATEIGARSATTQV